MTNRKSISLHLTALATTVLFPSDCTLVFFSVIVQNAGTAMTILVQDGQGTPQAIYVNNPAAIGNFYQDLSGSPVPMRGGIKVVIGGTAAGIVDVWAQIMTG